MGIFKDLLENIDKKNIDEICIRCKKVEEYKKISSKLKKKKTETYGDYESSREMFKETTGKYAGFKIEVRTPQIKNPNYISETVRSPPDTATNRWKDFIVNQNWSIILEMMTVKDIIKIDYVRANMFFHSKNLDFGNAFGNLLCKQIFAKDDYGNERAESIYFLHTQKDEFFKQIWAFLLMLASDDIVKIDMEKAEEYVKKYDKSLSFEKLYEELEMMVDRNRGMVWGADDAW